MRPDTLKFDLNVNGGLYAVRATPYVLPSKETRFRISVNDSPITIFGWDDQLDRFSVVEDRPVELGANLEMAIAGKLQNRLSQKKAA